MQPSPTLQNGIGNMNEIIIDGSTFLEDAGSDYKTAIEDDPFSTEIHVRTLMDISSDKDWICYVHHLRDNISQGIRLTRRRFQVFNQETRMYEKVSRAPQNTNQTDEATEINMDPNELTLDITEHYLPIIKCCKFLSISPDGNYIALSRYEDFDPEKPDENIVLEKGTSRCIIFKIDNCSKISHFTSLERCNGRAVFINRQDKLCLAVINTETLEIYSHFSQSKQRPSALYDLTQLLATLPFIHGYFPKINQRPFLEEDTLWIEKGDVSVGERYLRLMMISSTHIRCDVLVSSFAYCRTIRVWSLKHDGSRLTSFTAPDEDILAFSKDLKYAATIEEGIRDVKIYDMKAGLHVYTLKSCNRNDNRVLDVTHVRFCYQSRYLALSGLQRIYDDNGNIVKEEVVFEVWYIAAQKSIYASTYPTGAEHRLKGKTVQPFVYRGMTNGGEKALKGIYTYTDDQCNSLIYCVELKIDDPDVKAVESPEKQVKFEWIHDNDPYKGELAQSYELNDHEIQNHLNDHTHLKCASITVGNEKYLVRFGVSMIQMWKLGTAGTEGERTEEDQLVYIRAYKGPTYDCACHTVLRWYIYDFDSIKFVGGIAPGRVMVNITDFEWILTTDQLLENLELNYHTEEIFLPIINDARDINNFDSHTFESACQALHHLREYYSLPEWFQTNKPSDQNRREVEIEEMRFKATLRTYNAEERKEEKEKYDKKKQFKKKFLFLFEKVEGLIVKMITGKTFEYCNYFTSIAGSRVLEMLAEFEQGRDIINLKQDKKDHKSMVANSIENDEEEICTKRAVKALLVEYGKKNDNEINYRDSPKDHDKSHQFDSNPLISLIITKSFDLYNLIYNRILSDSQKIGPGCLAAIAGALIYLQTEGYTDLLLTSCQKLSYLSLDNHFSGISERELRNKSRSNIDMGYAPNIRNLESFSSMEQLQIYKITWWNISYNFVYRPKTYFTQKFVKEESSIIKWITKEYKEFQQKRESISYKKLRSGPRINTKVCVIPLPYFNSYCQFFEERHSNNKMTSSNSKSDTTQLLYNQKKSYNESYKNRSNFVEIASDWNGNHIFRQGDTVLEIMLQHKWKTFVRKRFLGVCLLNLTFYITYCTGVLFAFEMYGYDSDDNKRSIAARPEHLLSIVIMCISCFVLLGQEINQFIKSKKKITYLRSGYNWVDLAAITFPFFTLLQLILNWKYFYEICSLTTLILWLHGILRLRALSFVGVALEIIIQLSQKVWSVLFILILVVFAFTQSFIVLLRRREDVFFQETHNGSTTFFSASNISVAGNTTLFDVSSSNGFKDPFKAFYQVWLFIFGVWDPLTNGDAGDNRMLFVLCILFALITVLIFTNMMIALMANTIDEVRKKGNSVWVSHFAAVVAEIEQLWCFPNTKRSRNNNPAYIYYIASELAVQKQEKMLDDETRELREKVLGVDNY